MRFPYLQSAFKKFKSVKNLLGYCSSCGGSSSSISGRIVSKVKNFLYWESKRSNFQEAIQSINLHTFTNKRINVIFITFSVRMT